MVPNQPAAGADGGGSGAGGDPGLRAAVGRANRGHHHAHLLPWRPADEDAQTAYPAAHRLLHDHRSAHVAACFIAHSTCFITHSTCLLHHPLSLTAPSHTTCFITHSVLPHHHPLPASSPTQSYRAITHTTCFITHRVMPPSLTQSYCSITH